jgi:CMP-N,N'-diacetyllegionaminic acid synthase
MKLLFIIPARGGSKGLPGKNIKLLNGKPLIHYSIEIARQFVDDKDICVSTDDIQIVKCVNEIGLEIPFLRPSALAMDNSSTNDVIIHALNFYSEKGVEYDTVVVLQPTSPLRQIFHVAEAISNFDLSNDDMVVSVVETKSNPYYVLFEETNTGYLIKSKEGNYVSRQECPTVYEYNGAVYVISVKSLKNEKIVNFCKIKKYLMEEKYSIDIDTSLDWMICEELLKLN